MLGATFAVLPWVEGSLLALALVSAVGGFVVPFGLAAMNALIIEHTSGEERRTAFAAQHVAGSGGASVGMLTGGAVIALLGAETTMHVAGVVLMAVPLVLAGTNPFPTTPSGFDRSATGYRGSVTGGAGRHRQVAAKEERCARTMREGTPGAD